MESLSHRETHSWGTVCVAYWVHANHQTTHFYTNLNLTHFIFPIFPSTTSTDSTTFLHIRVNLLQPNLPMHTFLWCAINLSTLREILVVTGWMCKLHTHENAWGWNWIHIAGAGRQPLCCCSRRTEAKPMVELEVGINEAIGTVCNGK